MVQNLNANPQPPELLTVKAVAAQLSLSVSSVWRRVNDGTLPKPLKIGGSTRWRRAEIEAAFSQAV